VAAAALAACGGGDNDGDDDALAPDNGRLAADLRVEVRPEGPTGPLRTRRLECGVLGRKAVEPSCRRLGGLSREDLAPVSVGVACTQVYGGPATARVTGTLRGRRVSARFELSNGCEISRWRRNAELLGRPPTGPPAP
jgi:hypothetical protein